MGNSADFETRDNDNKINLLGRKLWWVSIVVILLSFCAYALTAFRTITWWDNAEYSLAAITFGVTHPPGSLLTVLLGWLVTKNPLGLTAIFKLNLLAGLGASITTAILVQTAVRYRRNLTYENSGVQPRPNSRAFVVGAILGGLAYAFSETTWTYSTKLSPYIFTALFSSAIMWALFRWWEDSSSEKSMQWLFVIALLFGLDFSVHRTNMLLVPAAFLWIVVGNWRVFKSIWSWIFSILGFVIGLSFQLIIIPMAAGNPYLNGGDPSTIGRFWYYVSLKQFGGNWLLDIFPRKAPFWSYQLHDYFNTFSANFFSTKFELGIWGIFPAIFGVFGLVLLWKSNRRLAIATIILFIIASLGAIMYFNLPENYFRSNDRHYMPSFVIFAFWIILGCGYFIGAISGLLRKTRWTIAIPALFIIWVLPSYQLARNYHSQDCSRNYFTYDFAHNLIATLPERAILFTNGDADTFNPWYLQGGEKMRPDVSIVNLPLLNMPSYVAQVLANNPDMVISLTSAEIENLTVRPWTDTTVSISARCDRQALNIPDSISLPDSVAFHITPNIMDKYLLAQDWMLLQIIAANAWQRPIYFAMTVSPDNLRWVAPYLRSEGVAQRLLPVASPEVDTRILSTNLMEKYLYRGLADSTIPLDEFTKNIDMNYYPIFIELAMAKSRAGDIAGCEQTIRFLQKAIPENRIGPLPESIVGALGMACQSQTNR
jgi:hypothetical protein